MTSKTFDNMLEVENARLVQSNIWLEILILHAGLRPESSHLTQRCQNKNSLLFFINGFIKNKCDWYVPKTKNCDLQKGVFTARHVQGELEYKLG